MKYLRNSEENITIKEIIDFENEYDVKLPESYKMFLLANNGGFCKSKDPEIDDALFLAIADVPRSLRSDLFQVEDKNLIPIALTLNEDYIYLNKFNGEIILVDRVIAPDFDVFIGKFLIQSI